MVYFRRGIVLNESKIVEIFNHLIRPVKNSIAMIASRVIITMVDDKTKTQSIQVSAYADEPLSEIENFQNHGFTSVPFKDSEALMISAGGQREHSYIIGVANKEKRPTGHKEGEAIMFFDKKHFIAVLEDGKIEMKNEKFDMVQLHIDTLEAIIAARTATLGGPQALINVKDPFPQILERYKTFLKT